MNSNSFISRQFFSYFYALLEAFRRTQWIFAVALVLMTFSFKHFCSPCSPLREKWNWMSSLLYHSQTTQIGSGVRAKNAITIMTSLKWKPSSCETWSILKWWQVKLCGTSVTSFTVFVRHFLKAFKVLQVSADNVKSKLYLNLQIFSELKPDFHRLILHIKEVREAMKSLKISPSQV